MRNFGEINEKKEFGKEREGLRAKRFLEVWEFEPYWQSVALISANANKLLRKRDKL